MADRQKVYMFKYTGYRDNVITSKTYVSAYQCYKATEVLTKKGIHVDFYEADLSWDWVDSIYNKNTIGEG